MPHFSRPPRFVFFKAEELLICAPVRARTEATDLYRSPGFTGKMDAISRLNVVIGISNSVSGEGWGSPAHPAGSKPLKISLV